MSATIVCIHGAGGGGWEYAKWKPTFTAAGHRVIANDLMPAAAGLTATTYADYVDQVHTWLPTAGPLILVGASMGGILALQIAATVEPAALVLVNSVLPAGVGSSRTPKSYPPMIEWANGTLEETRRSLFDSDEATIRWAWPQWRNESGAVLQTIADGIPLRPPACPALVVLGTADSDIPYQSGVALAEWARADVHLYHAMSHVGPLLSQRAEEVARAVMGWCEAHMNVGSL